MAVETPKVTISYPQRPRPTVTNVKISVGEPQPVIMNPGGNTCGVTTHSFVITPNRTPAESSTR